MKKFGIIVIALVSLAAIGCKKKRALGNKTVACENIHKTFMSRQDKRVWMDTCAAAPDENVRCLNLGMEEGKDDSCKKLVKSSDRDRLVMVLNGKPEQAPAPAEGGATAAGGAAEGSATE